MPEHHTPLIATISAGLVLAFIFGLGAHRLRISPLVGYLLAGVAVGPFTLGFVADQDLANQLADIGVILLMFAVGLHFSLKDLMAVRAIALPGAVLSALTSNLTTRTAGRVRLRSFQDCERSSGAMNMKQATAAGRDILVVAGAGPEVVAKLVIASTEPLGGSEALEASHTSNTAFHAAMILFQSVILVRADAVDHAPAER